MEYKSHKSASGDERFDRKTSDRTRPKSATSARTSVTKRPYNTRGDKGTYGERKSFGTRTARTDSPAKPHFVRMPKGERTSERSVGRPAYGTQKRSDAKPRYERTTEMRARNERPAYSTRPKDEMRTSYTKRTERPTRPAYPRNADSRSATFEKKPGAYGYKEQGRATRPRTRSIPHPRTQSWSRSRDVGQKEVSGTGTTSWGKVAGWYDEHLSSEDTYHKKVLTPNILRLVEPKKDEIIVDLACGEGYFTRALNTNGANMIGVDIGEELIAIAQKKSPEITFHVGSAEDLTMLPDAVADKVVIMLAIQNIENTQKVSNEAARILKKGGTFHIVMNHPAFRIPKRSSWDYDDKKKVQYRRVDQYLADSRVEIDMHPGLHDSPQTLSFHHPLQYYFKVLAKAGFAVDRLEEWISHKESDSGPRAQAENRARKEIPLFLYLRAIKN